MRLTPIVEKLKGAGRRRVYGALELAGLKTAPAQLPAYFVVPEGEDASANMTIGVHDQAAAFRFGVVIMLSAAGLRDDRVSDELQEHIDQIVGAIAGWTHPDASRACDYAGGRMLSVSGSTVSWMVSFRTARHIRKVPS